MICGGLSTAVRMGVQHSRRPSEYVRSLIRSDMETQAERLYVYQALLQGATEIARGEFVEESVLDIMNEP